MALYSVGQIKQAASDAGFKGKDIVIATAISMAENGSHEPDKTHKNSNGTTDYGAWQINSVHKDILASGNWKDLGDNAKMAYAVYTAAGNSFMPWYTFDDRKGGHPYLEHMKAAEKAELSTKPTDEKLERNSAGANDLLNTLNPVPEVLSFIRKGAVPVGVFVLGLVIIILGIWFVIKNTAPAKALKTVANPVKAAKDAVTK